MVSLGQRVLDFVGLMLLLLLEMLTKLLAHFQFGLPGRGRLLRGALLSLDSDLALGQVSAVVLALDGSGRRHRRCPTETRLLHDSRALAQR